MARSYSDRWSVLRKRLPLVVLAVVLGLVAGADRMGLFDPAPATDPATAPDASADRETYDGKSFRVVEAIDGDTFDIDIPDGRWPDTRIRLWGVDTPETHHPDKPRPDHFGPEASRFTRQLTLGKIVRIELEPGAQTRGKHGRLLAWVYLPDGRLLNALLVEQGYAYADPRFAHHRMGQLRALQRQAIRDGRGLWKDVRPAKLPGYFDGRIPR
ncbi:MAG: thermonuclease family protein [Phycisphaerae bacterium]